jgi:hypothetical protein
VPTGSICARAAADKTKDSRKNNRIGFPGRCDVVTRMRVILSHRADWYQRQHDRPGCDSAAVGRGRLEA